MGLSILFGLFVLGWCRIFFPSSLLAYPVQFSTYLVQFSFGLYVYSCNVSNFLSSCDYFYCCLNFPSDSHLFV